jgi:hypothetical protein
MFSTQTIVATRLASFTIALTMTLAMLLSIDMLATGDTQSQQLLQAQPSAPAQSVQA